VNKEFSPSVKDINGCIDILRALNCLPRWSAHIQDSYTEIAKLAFNCQIALIMFELVAYEQENNLHFTDQPKVRRNLLPRIALYRAFEKYEKCDILAETYQDLFEKHEGLEKHFLDYMKQKVVDLTSVEFFDHISGLDNVFEMRIYKAATALATYYECQEIKRNVSEKRFAEIDARQLERLQKYRDFPVIRELFEGCSQDKDDFSSLTELFSLFSSLRNRIRWVKRVPLRNYSVLGHSFDVAVYNYLLALNEHPDEPERAEIGFYIGLYHDIAEIWTGDMPSPLKDAIPGLRKRTEELEVKVLEENVFPLLPEWFVPKFKSFMLEMLPKNDRDYYKFGDNLAAYIEASTQLAAGSKDYYFEGVVVDGIIKAETVSVTAKKVMKKVRKDAHISWIKEIKYKAKRRFEQKKRK